MSKISFRCITLGDPQKLWQQLCLLFYHQIKPCKHTGNHVIHFLAGSIPPSDINRTCKETKKNTRRRGRSAITKKYKKPHTSLLCGRIPADAAAFDVALIFGEEWVYLPRCSLSVRKLRSQLKAACCQRPVTVGWVPW